MSAGNMAGKDKVGLMQARYSPGAAQGLLGTLELGKEGLFLGVPVC